MLFCSTVSFLIHFHCMEKSNMNILQNILHVLQGEKNIKKNLKTMANKRVHYGVKYSFTAALETNSLCQCLVTTPKKKSSAWQHIWNQLEGHLLLLDVALKIQLAACGICLYDSHTEISDTHTFAYSKMHVSISGTQEENL